jgi:hypothetical protein
LIEYIHQHPVLKGTTMKIQLIIPAIVCILSIHTTSVLAGDTPEERATATRNYLKAVPVNSMVQDLTSEMLKSVPPEQKVEIEALLKKALDPKFLEALTLETMPKHFTTKEINAMATFYATPEGASIMKKFGAYMADIMPAIQTQVIEALQPMLSGK